MKFTGPPVTDELGVCDCGCKASVTKDNRVILGMHADSDRVSMKRFWHFADQACRDTWWMTADGQDLFPIHSPGAFPKCDICMGSGRRKDVPSSVLVIEFGAPQPTAADLVGKTAIIAAPEHLPKTDCPKCTGTGEDRASGIHDSDDPTHAVDQNITLKVHLRDAHDLVGQSAVVGIMPRGRHVNDWWKAPLTADETLPDTNQTKRKNKGKDK